MRVRMVVVITILMRIGILIITTATSIIRTLFPLAVAMTISTSYCHCYCYYYCHYSYCCHYYYCCYYWYYFFTHAQYERILSDFAEHVHKMWHRSRLDKACQAPYRIWCTTGAKDSRLGILYGFAQLASAEDFEGFMLKDVTVRSCTFKGAGVCGRVGDRTPCVCVCKSFFLLGRATFALSRPGRRLRTPAGLRCVGVDSGSSCIQECPLAGEAPAGRYPHNCRCWSYTRRASKV